MTQLLPPKKDVALALLERSNVDVYLDPRSKGVVVPPQFRREPRLILKIGLNMPVPIPDLRLDDDSMSCTLSFNRAKFFCIVPWPSVFAMVGDDGRGMVWPDDVPQELAVRVAEEAGAPVEGEPASKPASSGPKRGRSNGGAAAATGEGASADAPTSSREPTEEGRRPKRARTAKGKKKEEPRRPVLVAVPPAAESKPSIEPVPAPVAAPAPVPLAPVPPSPEARDGVSPVRRAPPPPRGTRPKRELPPYLRVVK